jgi:UDP-N-acetylmuramoylalanine--D-glutamate ligase
MKKISKDLRPHIPTPVAVVGMGKSGDAAKKLLLLGQVPEMSIATFDAKALSANFNDPKKLMDEFQPRTLVVSPGVPLSADWIQSAKKQGVLITSEISLACLCLEQEKIIGVTGSVGKSTTVSLLGAGLQAFSEWGFVGGNLGTPFSTYAAEVLEGRQRADWVVLELSSYQLENCEGLKLDFSAITYLTPNHMERYAHLTEYYDTKWKIKSLTKETLFLNTQGGDLIEYAGQKTPEKVQSISKSDSNLAAWNISEARLIGQHNQDNIALAVAIAMSAGWPDSAVFAMKSFGGLAHRLENLGSINGVRYINDSKATAMDSVLIAVQAAVDSQGPQGDIWVLLGGRDKNLPWEQLEKLSEHTQCKFVFFGECRQVAQSKSDLNGESFPSLGEALGFIEQKKQIGDTVLLSPGGTSLDEFKSFEDRGDFFKRRALRS